ncbi:hypothetical protein [Nocardia terpenica]|uniref:Uncharacterized protein n=1 Tax=Nocardia terpenica TaxID=455432 RepID=A0A164JHY9_9NOCA|nr:hypothetical protein [Nocardia terpenica]KZM70421.1 hypothetical protein AWN90_03840 [Nocardia terpenica]NQE91103.1 hypothetical protein [Nocardia terpenica]
MIRPTRSQARVLKAIQNATVDITEGSRRIAEWTKNTAEPAPHRWHEDIQGRQDVRRWLESAARAGGVPQRWIDHVRERGERERPVRWRSDLYLRDPEPVDRDALLGVVGRDIAAIREIAALGARYALVGSDADAQAASIVERRLYQRWEHAAMLTQLLGITAAEAERLWATEPEWAARSAHAVSRLSPTVVGDRLMELAYVDRDMERIGPQAIALREAGFTALAARHAPPTPAYLVSEVKTALAVRDPEVGPEQEATPGRDIEHALEKVGLGGSATPPTAPVFSSAASHEAITVTRRAFDAAPVFSSAAEPEWFGRSGDAEVGL